MNRVKQNFKYLLKRQTDQSQSGVTLLLAILMLASILAISFSLATVLLVEVRTSGDIIKSEPAFFAAESVSEIGIFNIKRNVPAASSTMPSAVGSVQVASVVQNPLAPPVQQVQVDPSSSSYASTTSRFLLYNPNNSDCTQTSGGNNCGGYGRVVLTYLQTSNTDPLYVYLCQYDPSSTTDDCDHTPDTCPSGSTCTFPVNNYQLTRGSTLDTFAFLAGNLSPNKQYDLRLVNSHLTNQTIYVQLESFDSNGTTRKGLPYLGQKGLEVNTTNGGTTRSIRTVVPSGGQGGGSVSSGSSSGGFSNKYTITIDPTKVATAGCSSNCDQLNFPVLVSFSSTNLKTSTNGGLVQNDPNGYDIGFYSDPTCSTKYSWETESYSPTAGSGVYWVLIPTVSHSANTVFYMCYGNASIVTDQSNKTAVWDSNYKSVWHLPNGASLSGADSTSNAINPVSTTMTAIAGLVDGAAVASSGQLISYGGSGVPGLKITNNITMEWWMKTTNGSQQCTVDNQFRQSNNDGINVYSDPSDVVVNIGSGTTNVSKTFGSITTNNGAWHHVVTEFSSGTVTVYFDGVAQATQAAGFASIGYGSEPMYLAQNAATNRPYIGSLDEVRFSNIARSADWIKTEYNNLINPGSIGSSGTFYTVN